MPGILSIVWMSYEIWIPGLWCIIQVMLRMVYIPRLGFMKLFIHLLCVMREDWMKCIWSATHCDFSIWKRISFDKMFSPPHDDISLVCHWLLKMLWMHVKGISHRAAFTHLCCGVSRPLCVNDALMLQRATTACSLNSCWECSLSSVLYAWQAQTIRCVHGPRHRLPSSTSVQ